MLRNRFKEDTYNPELGCFSDDKFHCKGGGGGDSTTSVKPSKAQEAILNKQLDLANKVEAGGELDFYGGDTVAGQNALTGMGQQSALNQIPALQNLFSQQSAGLSGLLSPGTVNAQGVAPGTEGAISGLTNTGAVQAPSLQSSNAELTSALTNPITRQFQEQILPGISSAASSQGAFGGSRQDILEGQASADASGRIADVLTRASVGLQGQQAQQGFQAESLRQQGIGAGSGLSLQLQQQLAQQGQNSEQLRQQSIGSGLQLAPGVANQALLPSQIQSGIGGDMEAREQQQIDADRERFEFGQFAETDAANRVNSLLSSVNFGNVTSTESSGGGK